LNPRSATSKSGAVAAQAQSTPHIGAFRLNSSPDHPALVTSLCYLRATWAAILQITNIEEDDNFFIQGGDSLLGMMLITALAEKLNTELTMADLYDNPTLAAMSALISTRLV
jgi:aryl carrier-like protein